MAAINAALRPVASRSRLLLSGNEAVARAVAARELAPA